jgi:cyclase
MLKKRLVGVITVRGGLAVQSVSYGRYLPLGKPGVLAENLDRWGADEIVIQCIDRSISELGPNFAVLEEVAEVGLSTPIIYVGGIRSASDAIEVVRRGADRIGVDSILHKSPSSVLNMSDSLGAQAVVGVLPISVAAQGLQWFDYQNRTSTPLSDNLEKLIAAKKISELMLVDWKNEGRRSSELSIIIERFPQWQVPLIAFGGLHTPDLAQQILNKTGVSAVAIGNYLNYREHGISYYRDRIFGPQLRRLSLEGIPSEN